MFETENGTGNIDTAEDFDSLLKGMNGPGEHSTAPAEEENDDADPNAQGEDPANGSGNEQPAQNQTSFSKDNKAFAELRVKNRQATQALYGVLQKMGLDPRLASDPQALLNFLEEQDISQQAADMKLPPELLQRMHHLEKTVQQTEAERLSNNAIAGFEAVEEQYGLSEDELRAFALQLQEDNINPFEQEIDILREYKLRNFDAILEKERAAAVQAALSKQQTAAQHSTTPAKSKGKSGAKPGGTEINTMAQFDQMFHQL